MDPDDLDALLDRELKRLPPPRAPGTLLPRVLQATTARPAGATGWPTWPLGWRIASVAAAVVLVTVGWFTTGAAPGALGEAAQAAGDAVTVVRVFRDVLLQPVVTYFFVLGIALALTCALAWAGLELALGGASHR